MTLPLNTEIENVLKHSFKHLHSSNVDSAEKIRLALDDIIKTRFGSSKMLINTLNKKIILEECCLPETTKTAEQRDTEGGTKTCTSFYSSDGIASEEENLTEFSDLACVLCGAMVVAAGNRLVECSECHSLYHQECHKPIIPDSAANAEDCPWFCYNCKNKYVSQNVCNKIQPNDSELATESTHYIKSPEVLTMFPATAKACSSEFTVNTNKEDSSSQSSNSAPTATINIVSSDKRVKLIKKQTKHHDAKRKK